MPIKKVPVQVMPQLWSLYKSLLPKKPDQAIPLRLENLRHTDYRQVHCMCKIVLFVTNLKIPVQKIFCLQLKIQHTQTGIKNIPPPAHLITKLAYRLKSHHTRNLYLRTRLDTCADVNIMPASMYRLMFKDLS